MDALLSETDDDGRPVAYNRVAGAIRYRERGWCAPCHRRDQRRPLRHRPHDPRAELDVLEHGPGTRTYRHRPTPTPPPPRLVREDGQGHGIQPRRRGEGVTRLPPPSRHLPNEWSRSAAVASRLYRTSHVQQEGLSAAQSRYRRASKRRLSRTVADTRRTGRGGGVMEV